MTVMMDLIGSALIAGFVVLMGLRLNAGLVGSTDTAAANLTVQESMVDIVRTIEYDFRKMGYGLADPKFAIAIADSDHLRFRADMDRDGDIDSVDWYVGTPVTHLPNPNIRVLYRRVNMGTPVGAALGVTQFRLRYLTQDGVPTTVLSQMWIIETTLRVESPYRVADQVKTDERYEDMRYAAAFWRQTRLASRNIKRHN
jgi:hypothetical protein